jgi:hypothetical protein
MKRLILIAAAAISAVSFVAGPAVSAADKPLVIESGKLKQLPAATTLQVNASGTGAASINIPHGTAPTSPTNGDCWTTTGGLYCRINGATVGPYGTGTGGNINSKDEGVSLTSATTSVDYVGAGPSQAGGRAHSDQDLNSVRPNIQSGWRMPFGPVVATEQHIPNRQQRRIVAVVMLRQAGMVAAVVSGTVPQPREPAEIERD